MAAFHCRRSPIWGSSICTRAEASRVLSGSLTRSRASIGRGSVLPAWWPLPVLISGLRLMKRRLLLAVTGALIPSFTCQVIGTSVRLLATRAGSRRQGVAELLV